MWYQPLNFAEHIIISADVLMSNVIFIFTIGILGYLLREYCCQEEKKNIMKYNLYFIIYKLNFCCYLFSRLSSRFFNMIWIYYFT